MYPSIALLCWLLPLVLPVVLSNMDLHGRLGPSLSLHRARKENKVAKVTKEQDVKYKTQASLPMFALLALWP